jgi:hypothetical protein
MNAKRHPVLVTFAAVDDGSDLLVLHTQGVSRRRARAYVRECARLFGVPFGVGSYAEGGFTPPDRDRAARPSRISAKQARSARRAAR